MAKRPLSRAAKKLQSKVQRMRESDAFHVDKKGSTLKLGKGSPYPGSTVHRTKSVTGKSTTRISPSGNHATATKAPNKGKRLTAKPTGRAAKATAARSKKAGTGPQGRNTTRKSK
jgi:hypothetical protein